MTSPVTPSAASAAPTVVAPPEAEEVAESEEVTSQIENPIPVVEEPANAETPIQSASPDPVPVSLAQEMAGLETGSMHFFSPSSPWNRSLSIAEPLDPESPRLMEALAREAAREQAASEGPSINTRKWSVALYTVGPSQATVPVRLTSQYSVPALSEAWSAVPLPAEAQAASGTDGHLVVWQPSTDRLWEFWRLAKGPSGWSASWGGAMQHVSTSSGVYGPECWPGAVRSWGASASSLSIAGGLITFEDLKKGAIDHALAIGIPQVRAGVFAAPAVRSDGKSVAASALPEGAHLRLDPTLNLNALHLPPLTLELARAAQRYGIIVRDGASNLTFYAQDPTPTGTDPYKKSGGFFEGSYPAELLSHFPWQSLQLLKMELTPTK